MKQTNSFKSHERVTSYEMSVDEFLEKFNINADQLLNIGVNMDIIHLQVKKSESNRLKRLEMNNEIITIKDCGYAGSDDYKRKYTKEELEDKT